MSAPGSTNDYFYTPELKGLVQQLVHMAFFGEGLSVVKGGQGSGKSRLAHELQTYLDQAHQVASLELKSETALPDCMEALMNVLGIASPDSLSVGESLSELRHYCQALVQDKKLAILIIDNAHYLDDQAIGALVSLLQGKGEVNFGLHLLFFSEPGLDHRIDALQIIDVAVYDFTIPEFSPSEMTSFLSQNDPNAEDLSPSELQKLWASSKGLPGRALDLRSNNGQEAKKTEHEGKSKAKLGIPFGHIAAVFLLAAVLFYSIAYKSEEKTESPAVSKPKENISFLATPKPHSESDSQGSEKSTLLSAQKLANTEIESAAPGSASQLTPLVSPLPSSLPKVTPTVMHQIVENNEGSVPQNVSLKSTGGQEQELDADQQQQLGADIALKKAEEAVSPKPEPVPQVKITPAPIPSAPPIKVVQNEIEPSLVLSKEEAFLMAQNPNFYTIQVVAAGKKESLSRYIAHQPNKDALRIYRGWRKQKVWYVVVEGVYTSRDTASQALKKLPKEQAKAGAWPRKLSSIQQEIETFRRNFK